MRKTYWLEWFNYYGSPPLQKSPPVKGGVARVSLSRTREETAGAHRARLQSWVDYFEGQPAIAVVLLAGRASDQLMEAAFGLDALRALFSKESVLTSLDCIAGASRLKYLHLNYADRLADVAGLGFLDGLKGLGVCPARNVSDFMSLQGLNGLRQLRMGHPDGKLQPVDALEPVIGDGCFSHLELRDVKPLDGNWEPLLRLRGLRYLTLPRSVPADLRREVCSNNPALPAAGAGSGL